MKSDQMRAVRDLVQSFTLEMASHVSALETCTPLTAFESHKEIKAAWETLDMLSEFLFGQTAADMLEETEALPTEAPQQ